MNNDEAFYVGIIKTVARAIGWERLKALVERLEREEKGR